MSVNNPQSYPVKADSYLGTTAAARLGHEWGGETTDAAVTIQAIGAIFNGVCEGVSLYVDTCPAAGEKGVLRVELTVAEVKHLRKILKAAITAD